MDSLEEEPTTDPATWLGFRIKYETEKGPAMPAAIFVWKSAANAFEQICSPVKLSDVTPARISSFEVGLRNRGLSDATIATYLRAIRAAVNWAADIELIRAAPRVRIPKSKGERRARGRAVTGEEFDRLCLAMKELVGEERYPSWHRLLRGLWLSGLRLGESLDLWWDRDDKIIPLNIDGRRPLLAIPGRLQKSKRDETCPLTPEFVKFLRETNANDRTGPIFTPLGKGQIVRSVDFVSRQISAAGRKAKIIVARDDDAPRYATAHDLRRSFGDRWAQKVMPAVLMVLMRHRTIDTTMTYYVGRSAEQTAGVLWGSVASRGDKKGDTQKTSKP